MNIESYIQLDEALSGHLQPEQLIIPLQVIKAVAIYPNKT